MRSGGFITVEGGKLPAKPHVPFGLFAAETRGPRFVRFSLHIADASCLKGANTGHQPNVHFLILEHKKKDRRAAVSPEFGQLF